MIEQARATGLYAELEVADMLQGLRGKPDASADLILAADAMVYVADLAPLLREAARVLAPGGLFAFTAETHDGEGVVARRRTALRPQRGLCARARSQAAGLKLVALRESLGAQRGQCAGAGPGGRRDAKLESRRYARSRMAQHCRDGKFAIADCPVNVRSSHPPREKQQ